MDKNNRLRNFLLGLIVVCLALISCRATCDAASKKPDTTAQSSEAGSQITVNRSASVGSGVFVTLSVDGKRVRTLIKGSVYKGTLPPGKHVLSIMPDPNTTGQRETKTEVIAEKGRAYSFIVSRDKSGQLVLVKNP